MARKRNEKHEQQSAAHPPAPTVCPADQDDPQAIIRDAIRLAELSHAMRVDGLDPEERETWEALATGLPGPLQRLSADRERLRDAAEAAHTELVRITSAIDEFGYASDAVERVLNDHPELAHVARRLEFWGAHFAELQASAEAVLRRLEQALPTVFGEADADEDAA